MFVTIIFWAAFFVIDFNVAMMIPLLPFVAREIGLTSSHTGLEHAAFPIVALFSNLALGPLIDRFGRKSFIVGGAWACAIILVFTAAGRSALQIELARAATGVFMPMIGASVFAAIADYVPMQSCARVTGYVTSAAPIAFLCSISLGVALGGLVTWQLPVLVFAAICAVLAIAATQLPPTGCVLRALAPISSEVYRRRLLSHSLSADARLLLLSYFCWSAGIYLFLGLYPISRAAWTEQSKSKFDRRPPVSWRDRRPCGCAHLRTARRAVPASAEFMRDDIARHRSDRVRHSLRNRTSARSDTCLCCLRFRP